MVVLLQPLAPCLFALMQVNTEDTEPLGHLHRIYSDKGASRESSRNRDESTVIRKGREQKAPAGKTVCEQ